MRFALGIEYDGTAYNGWQKQQSGLGVQQRVEEALQTVANHPVEVTCAGRTDTGVHASGQVVHFDSESERSERGWLLGANSNLPDDIAVNWARQVDRDFHARFSATGRNYHYKILNRLERSALFRHRAWWIYAPLDAGRMHSAAQCLLGEHDFSTFRAAGCRANTAKRNLTDIAVTREGAWISLTVSANAFLQHMVRNIVGSLVRVGNGEESIDWLRTILRSCDRKRGGIAAPPHGLTLVSVDYPATAGVPRPDNSDWLCLNDTDIMAP